MQEADEPLCWMVITYVTTYVEPSVLLNKAGWKIFDVWEM